MRYKSFLVAVFCVSANCLYAQDNAIRLKIDAIEKANANADGIKELRTILASSPLSDVEKLAIQTTLIHKYQELKQWDTCLHYCQTQLALAHQQKNTLTEATFYKLIGSTYYYIPEKDRAVEYWNKCIEISETNQYNILLEQCYHNVGVIYLEREVQFDLAEKYLQKALNFGLSNHVATSTDNNMHRRVLATLYERTSKLDKAESLFLDVIKNCEATKDSFLLAETMMFYSQVLVKKKNFKKALETSEKSLDISRKTKSIDLISTSLTLHAKNLHDAGNDKEAYQYEKELNYLIRERFNGDLNSKISEAEAKFKNAETIHEKEVTILEARKEKQIYIASIIGLLAAAGSAFFYLNQKRKYRKKVEQLKMQQQVQEEKERLSRDLHDNLGSQLALLSNSVEQLDTTNKKQQGIGGEIDKVKNTSKQLLQTLRETIWVLNKEEMSAEDFFDKLVEYTSRYLQSYPSIQLSINENFEETKTINSNHALQLFRICQEVINNACKYSGSEILILKGISSRSEIQILIEDRGMGFDISAINSNDHYGLQNMKQRAVSIGASLEINTKPGTGTSVSIGLKT